MTVVADVFVTSGNHDQPSIITTSNSPLNIGPKSWHIHDSTLRLAKFSPVKVPAVLPNLWLDRLDIYQLDLLLFHLFMETKLFHE